MWVVTTGVARGFPLAHDRWKWVGKRAAGVAPAWKVPVAPTSLKIVSCPDTEARIDVTPVPSSTAAPPYTAPGCEAMTAPLTASTTSSVQTPVLESYSEKATSQFFDESKCPKEPVS